ncbi:lysophospholipid acyltransferase LPCAT4 isoform X1 [Pteropus alecto]|uniref:Lysophosphatidylcholine acyltransferase 4 n=1 Tax=Pteropus alecto TaxID=9402 RepID=L5K1L1_PTEAL|nr:lysophospholipid acyltransferase LPCAT4 isoform X1 [Pteropus alecto]XP_039699935.1 lysophospholipid acyltransferase LPCAT4 isoform X1 [Pteropus giganteus]ELK05584.1 Lysophosphatidylcholine acyltransferase 4 [Pteropus alecto]
MSQGSSGDWAPLEPTSGPPAPPNPFVHELRLSRLQRVKFCLLGALLAPIRVLLAFIVLFLLWPFAWLQVAGLTEEQLQEPLTGWRKTVCHNGVLGLSRVLFFLLGFLRIRVRGQRASRLQAPVLVAAPHSTFFDPIVLLPCDLPKVVSRAENLSVPVIGALLRFNQAILVSRHDPASRRRVVEEVRRRATSGGKWPQVLFFPEGTCSNKKALLKFKPGAFIAGVPVQPVLIRYPNSLDTTSWAWRGPGVLKVLWLTASQPCSIVDVEFLPVYHPSPEESRDPTLYANNVQRVMAQALGIPATECEFVGSLPVIVVGRLKVALEPQLWELGKVLRNAGLSPGYVDAGAEPARNRMISQEEFARQLQLSDPQTVAGAFNYFQKDASGLVDFRDVALALAALDGSRDLEELTLLAFELFAEEQAEGPGRLLYRDGFSTILHLLLGSPRPAAATLHAELCQAGSDQGLSLCQFQDFSLRDPLHGKLFSTYLRPSQTPNASSPGSPTALANGTVHVPKQKGD